MVHDTRRHNYLKIKTKQRDKQRPTAAQAAATENKKKKQKTQNHQLTLDVMRAKHTRAQREESREEEGKRLSCRKEDHRKHFCCVVCVFVCAGVCTGNYSCFFCTYTYDDTLEHSSIMFGFLRVSGTYIRTILPPDLFFLHLKKKKTQQAPKNLRPFRTYVRTRTRCYEYEYS